MAASYDTDESIEQISRTVKKLTDWEKEPTLEDLKQDLMEAQPYHDSQVDTIDNWIDNITASGAAKITPKKGQTNSTVVPKLIRKQAEWRYASLSEPFLNTPEVFRVNPITWEDKESAKQNQMVLNSQFNTKIDKVGFIDEFVRTAVDEGTVITRVGWDFQEEEIEVEKPVIELRPNPEWAQQHEQIHQLHTESPSEYNALEEHVRIAHEATMEQGVPLEPVIIDTETVKEFKTIRNQPTLEVCDYKDIIIDPTCKGEFDKASFIIYRFESSLTELEREGKYQNLGEINTVHANPLNDPDDRELDAPTFRFKDKPRKRLTVYEYWGFRDIHDTGLVQPFVATWVGDTLIRMEENPFPDKKLPFVIVKYLPKRKTNYGEPDGALLEDNQKIIGAVTRGMIDIMGKSANGQMGVRKDALDMTNYRKFMRGDDYEFNSNVDPRQAFHMHTYPEIPQSAQFMLQQQQLEAESMTGVKAFHNGISGEGLGRTATGVRGALDAASKREVGILRRLAQGIIDIGHKLISMNAEFLGDTEVVRITNDEFVEVRRDDLEGKFDLQLSISTAEENNAKAEELAFMLQTMGNNFPLEMSQIILSEIATLKRMPELAKRIEQFQPEPDPAQQQMQQLEIAKLQAEIENLQADTQEKLAKAGSEGAKAEKYSAEADKTNLDFVEQEAGITQNRELEKQARKDEGNLALNEINNQANALQQQNTNIQQQAADVSKNIREALTSQNQTQENNQNQPSLI